ncbi:MAG: hypothetical protein K0Q43_1241 [Ramlibacter sp.]|jgi:hypothetical protein|nr:hypothetical protein [Ramlibacter sp.]
MRAPVLFLTVFFGIYFDAGIGWGSLRIPSVSALALLLLLPNRLRALSVCSSTILLFAAMAVFSYLIGSERTPDDKAISSGLQTAWTIYFGTLVFMALRTIKLDVLGRTALYCAVALTAFACLEVLGPLESLSNWFGQTVYGTGVGFSYYGVHDFSIERDIALAGFRRPTVMSPEPSTAALGITVLGLTYYSCHQSSRRAAFCLALVSVLWMLFRSPTVLVGGAFVLLCELFRQRRGMLRIGVAAGAVIFLAVVLELLQERVARVITDPTIASTTSEGIRLILPFINLWNSLAAGNVFGVGPGAQYDRGLVQSLNPFGVEQFGTNAFALLLFYYGPALGFLLVYLIYRIYRRIGLDASDVYYFVGTFGFLTFSLGAIESVRLLGYLSIMTVAFYHVRLKCRTNSQLGYAEHLHLVHHRR